MPFFKREELQPELANAFEDIAEKGGNYTRTRSLLKAAGGEFNWLGPSQMRGAADSLPAETIFSLDVRINPPEITRTYTLNMIHCGVDFRVTGWRER